MGSRGEKRPMVRTEIFICGRRDPRGFRDGITFKNSWRDEVWRTAENISAYLGRSPGEYTGLLGGLRGTKMNARSNGALAELRGGERNRVRIFEIISTHGNYSNYIREGTLERCNFIRGNYRKIARRCCIDGREE